MNGNPERGRIEKIVFFLASPLTKRDEDRFGLRILQKNGFDVEVWDLTLIVDPANCEKSYPANKHTFENYRVFYSTREVVSAIETLPCCRCLIFAMLDYSRESLTVFRAISKSNLPYALLAYNFMSYSVSKRKSFMKRVMNITPEKLKAYSFHLIPFRCLGVKPASIMLALGGKFDLSKWPINEKTQMIYSHYFDYDLYLEEMEKRCSPGKQMGVFLDNYLPFHPDWVSQKVISPEEYYPLVCRFFNFVEQKYNVHITIAAHPRSNYDALPDYFEGRPVIKDRTVRLVRESQFVILHDSWSINFAVLFNRPVIFITSDKMKQASLAGTHFIDFMASLFGKTPINLNDTLEVDWDQELSINEKRYRDFKRTYIKDDGAEDIPIWELFSRHLKCHF